jgi:hypothetical protein
MIAVYFSCWLLKGIVRRFDKERQTLFSRLGSYLFLVGYEIILLGLIYPHLPSEKYMTYVFWITSLLPVLLIIFGSLRNLDKYIEYSRVMQSKIDREKSMMPQMILYSNLSLAGGLFAIWALFATALVFINDGFIEGNLKYICVIFSFYFFFMLMLELYSLYNSPNNKIGLLVGFVLIVHFFLPALVSAIIESKTLYAFSPIGYFAYIFPDLEGYFDQHLNVLLVNLLLSLLPLILVIKQYKLILFVRKKM